MAHRPFQSPYQSQTLAFSFVLQLVVQALFWALHNDTPPLSDARHSTLIPHHVRILRRITLSALRLPHTIIQSLIPFESFILALQFCLLIFFLP